MGLSRWWILKIKKDGKKDRIMKKSLIFSLMAVLAVYGCQVEEIVSDNNTPEPLPEGKIFTAIIDDDTSTPTSTHLDDGSVLWNQNDRVSVFDATTQNLRYQVTDESAGQKEATLTWVSGDRTQGTPISNNVAYYPYASGASIAESEGTYTISGIALPTTQYYVAGSFGNGAFPMVAINAAEHTDFKFKNLLGGLKLQLTGTATIRSISIKGNGNEVLCGPAEVTVSNGEMPSIILTGTDVYTKTVTLYCSTPVTLNKTTPTPFIIALPPVTLTQGFTVTVTDSNGKQMKISTSKSKEMVRSSLRKMPAVELLDYEDEPFTITSTGSTTVSISAQGSPTAISLEFKKGADSWAAYTIGDGVSLSNGESVQFRAGQVGNSTFSQSYSKYYKIVVSGTGTIMASGNVMSLLDQSMTRTDVPENSFDSLFGSCAKLTDASNLKLPATTLAECCYESMFMECTSLTQAPALPATTLADNCYDGMFSGCSSLTTAPSLPATTLAESCYDGMFNDCTSLTQAPSLPATTLADNCYNGMFLGCTSLTQAPALPATTLMEGCYEYMFKDCTSLTQAPVLPATTLPRWCYHLMFEDCTSLNAVTCLATDIHAQECTSNWLFGVAATGTFTKAAGMTGWRLNSDSGIPDGWTVNEEVNYLAEPFTITSTGSTTVSISAQGSPTEISLEFKKGADSWAAYTIGDGVSLSGGQSVQFRAREGGNKTFSKGSTSTTITNYYKINITDTGTVIASGNIMSLLDSSLESTLPAYSFYYLFYNCEKLTDASNLKLPAETLEKHCYIGMFYGCSSLTTAPALPATTLAQSCYKSMFQGCTALTTAPDLPATTLVSSCYQSMFQGCTALTTAPDLPATTLIGSCYNSMFYGCTSLTTAPDLPATTLQGNCYQSMFQDCTALTTAPDLPATSLQVYCYSNMFQGCISLITAPVLRATKMYNYCYQYMFKGCTSLIATPVLRATSLQKYCYRSMFQDCTSLKTVTCLATDISAQYCTQNWLANVGIGGTFIKAESMDSWTTGASGIPSGWTPVDYSE